MRNTHEPDAARQPPMGGNDTDDARLQQLRQWLTQLNAQADLAGLDLASMAPVSGDASFRRYFRIPWREQSLIVMDAPLPAENCATFVHIGQMMSDGGLIVPKVYARNIPQGFLLLEDLGEKSYLHMISEGRYDDAELQLHYRRILRSLIRMQQCPGASTLPAYDRARLLEELDTFTHWYLQVHHHHTPSADTLNALAEIFDLLARQATDQARVFVHRDFHSPNLLPGTKARPEPGIIDFQDALYGPVSYDIASLVTDARTTWEEAQQLDWAIRYWQDARSAGLPVPDDFARFHFDYEWMGLQRNLRILGVFARLSHRDNKHHYLAHVPRVLSYVRQTAGRYAPFRPLLRLLDTVENIPQQHGYTF